MASPSRTQMPKPPAVRIPIVVEQLSEFIREYVYLENPDLYLLIALWVLGTHLHMDFDYMGYLYAYSPEKQSGKSTLLKVLKPLVFNPSGPQVSPSPAVLFRLAKGYTQLLDEADSWTNMEELRNILNAGFEKGGVVQRCGGQRTNFKVETFEVYGPRALAGIGLNKLPETTQDRTFAISMIPCLQVYVVFFLCWAFPFAPTVPSALWRWLHEQPLTSSDASACRQQ